MEPLDELKQRYFRAIRATGALLIKKEPFKLRSGGYSHIYLSHNHFLSEHKHIELLVDIYRGLIENHVQDEYRVCAVDSVMSPIIAGAFAVLVEKDVIVVKERQLSHGTEQQVFGIVGEDEIVVIDDMTSTGTTIINAVDALRQKGARVNYAVVSATRDQTAEQRLKEAGVHTLYIASFSDILSALWRDLTDEEKQLVSTELEIGD